MKPNPCQDGHLNWRPGMLLRNTPGVRQLRDARGISCGFVCDRCEEYKRSQYRPEVFDDANYEAEDL